MSTAAVFAERKKFCTICKDPLQFNSNKMEYRCLNGCGQSRLEEAIAVGSAGIKAANTRTAEELQLAEHFVRLIKSYRGMDVAGAVLDKLNAACTSHTKF